MRHETLRQKIQKVAKYFNRNPKSALRTAKCHLATPPSLVQQIIINRLIMFPYRVHIVRELEDRYYKACILFAHWYRPNIQSDSPFRIAYCFPTNESFTLMKKWTNTTLVFGELKTCIITKKSYEIEKSICLVRNVSKQNYCTMLLWWSSGQRRNLSAFLAQLFSFDATNSTSRYLILTRWSTAWLQSWSSNAIKLIIIRFVDWERCSNELDCSFSHAQCSWLFFCWTSQE